MMNGLHNLPDWMIGTSIAALAWFGLCYVELAPRALANEVEENTVPLCVEQLELDQSRTLSRLYDDRTRERESRTEQIQNKIRIASDRLRQMRGAVDTWNDYQDMLNQSGLSMFIPTPQGAVPTQSELNAAQEEIDAARNVLANLPEITLPQMPSSEVAAICSCAALQAFAGERKNYALSLASFRLLSPSDVGDAQDRLSQVLNWTGCGEKTWETLS